MTTIADNLQQKVHSCLNGNLSADIANWNAVKAGFSGCLDREVTLDPEIKKQLMKLVDECRQDTLEFDKAAVGKYSECRNG